MEFVGFGSMLPTIHVFMFASHFLVIYPVYVECACHTHGKMSHRHLMFLRISWNTMIVKCISSYVFCNMP